MILSFKEQFVSKIKEGTKIHTIREDKTERWKVGMKVHFWKGNPRNTKQNPYQFGVGVVSKIDKIVIIPKENKIWVFINGICENINTIFLLDQFAKNDGFESWEEMKQFFNNETFEGRLIYFTFLPMDHSLEGTIFEKYGLENVNGKIEVTEKLANKLDILFENESI